MLTEIYIKGLQVDEDLADQFRRLGMRGRLVIKSPTLPGWS